MRPTSGPAVSPRRAPWGAKRRCIALLVCFAPLAALAENVREPEGFWSGPINAPTPATLTGGAVIHAPALARMLENEASVVVIDVSNEPRKPEGLPEDVLWAPPKQEVIPGAVWIPNVGMATIEADEDALFRRHLEQATGGEIERLIVIYCHENCWLSWNAAKRAIGYGYRKVYWFPEGIEGWRAEGFTTVTAAPLKP